MGVGGNGRAHALDDHVIAVAASASATPVSLTPLSKTTASARDASSVTVITAVFQEEHGPATQEMLKAEAPAAAAKPTAAVDS